MKQCKDMGWEKTIKSILFSNNVKCDSEQFLIEDIQSLLIEERKKMIKKMDKKCLKEIEKIRGEQLRQLNANGLTTGVFYFSSFDNRINNLNK